jgi:glycerol-3-phosphate dehydrogenase
MLEPRALEQEIDFILKTVGQYFTKQPTKKDVLSVFAGLRPLAAPQKDTDSTKEISRDHKLMVSTSGLVTITGGKWTTYRKMAEETVNKVMEVGGLNAVPSPTKELPVHGCTTLSAVDDSLAIYGTDEAGIKALVKENPLLSQRLTEGLPYIQAEVIWAVRNEMARTVEDVLARRIRMLFLDARAAMDAAPKVAELMAKELGYDEQWEHSQLERFYLLAHNYLLEPYQKEVAIHH